MKSLFRNLVVNILKLEAILMLKRHKPKIVAVTGSVGKTSTKDAIYTVLALAYSVRKSSKSFNSEIGVPLTILGLPNAWNNPLLWLKNILEGAIRVVVGGKYPEILVLEVGADRKGDIKKVATWLKPDIAVVTRLSKVPVHVEFFSSPKELMEEKGSLIKKMKKGGTAVLNADDEDVMSFKEFSRGSVVTFGTTASATFIGSNYKVLYENGEEGAPVGVTFKVDHEGNCVPINIRGSVGKQHVSTSLCALAVGHVLGINLVEAGQAFRSHDTPPGRMKLIEGSNNSTIIDDTYNSSPIAAAEALVSLSQIDTPGKKIVIMGDMMELGDYSLQEHEKLGDLVADVADVFIAVGARMSKAYDSFASKTKGTKQAFLANDSLAVQPIIATLLNEHDVVLIKGSQSMRMEKIVESIMRHPEKKGELLVRQEEEWKLR